MRITSGLSCLPGAGGEGWVEDSEMGSDIPADDSADCDT